MSHRGALLRAASQIARDAAENRPCQYTRNTLIACCQALDVPTAAFVRAGKGFKERGRLAGHLSFKGRIGRFTGHAHSGTLATRIFRMMLARGVRRAQLKQMNAELSKGTA